MSGAGPRWHCPRSRIVVLDLPFLDALTALDIRPVGFAGTSKRAVPEYLLPQFPEGSEPKFIGERKQPNLELIMSLEPQLIVANPDRHKLIRSSLDVLAPTIALDDNSTDDIRKMIQSFSTICQEEALGRAVVQELDQSLPRHLRAARPKIQCLGGRSL